MKVAMHVLLVLGLLGASAAVCANLHAPAGDGPFPQSARKHEPQSRKSTNSSKSEHRLTLEQAVQRVQNQTGGKVLKADSQNRGRIVEYRIKVLTPDGHVRVVTLRSDDHDAK